MNILYYHCSLPLLCFLFSSIFSTLSLYHSLSVRSLSFFDFNLPTEFFASSFLTIETFILLRFLFSIISHFSSPIFIFTIVWLKLNSQIDLSAIENWRLISDIYRPSISDSFPFTNFRNLTEYSCVVHRNLYVDI